MREQIPRKTFVNRPEANPLPTKAVVLMLSNIFYIIFSTCPNQLPQLLQTYTTLTFSTRWNIPMMKHQPSSSLDSSVSPASPNKTLKPEDLPLKETLNFVLM